MALTRRSVVNLEMFANQLHLPKEKLHQLPSRLKGDRCLFLAQAV
jgi:hypothetical protein